MKNKKVTAIVLCTLVAVLALGVGLVIFLGSTKSEEAGGPEETVAAGTFAEYTDIEIFEKVPALVGAKSKVGKASDFGYDNYLLDVNWVSLEEYRSYQQELEKAGFVKHSDNGEEGMEGYVYTSAYTKDDLTLTISYVVRFEKVYVSVSNDLELSDHMIYKDEYVANLPDGAKTTLHMLELHDNGNSFLIQLKNGHFVLHDGGNLRDAPYLLDYMESLVPEGEKPVIEAWIISHAHVDHYGALREIASDIKYINRIYVDGIYFTRFNDAFDTEIFPTEGNLKNANRYIRAAASALKNEAGKEASFYRMQLGQRYYFCDTVMDICFTLEQLSNEAYQSQDFNDTSTWIMTTIEGQRFFCGGDGSRVETMTALTYYDSSYFDVDIFAVLHHGINVFNYFTDYCTADTVLYTSWRLGSLFPDDSTYARVEENAHLQEVAKESIHRGDGTVILEFPYTVGSYKKTAPCDWRYDFGSPTRKDLSGI